MRAHTAGCVDPTGKVTCVCDADLAAWCDDCGAPADHLDVPRQPMTPGRVDRCTACQTAWAERCERMMYGRRPA